MSPFVPQNAVHLDPDDTPEQSLSKAAHLKPSERQRAWQAMELTAFVHFNMPTFTNEEGGTGLEQPSQFDPTALDVRQWLEPLRDAGFKMVILTTKHADGFLLWPSRYSQHTVRESPYKDGRGDIVREFVDTAHELGLRVGLYFSPLNRQEMRAVPSTWVPGQYRFGGSSVKPRRVCQIPEDATSLPEDRIFSYTLDEYNCLYLRQLYELLTEYGPVDEFWLDGNADTSPDADQVYEGQIWYEMARKLQPDILFFNGWDIRWVGNEEGFARETEWSVLPIQHGLDATFPEIEHRAEDLGSRATWAGAKHFVWYPGEVDVSMRPGWFYHPDEEPKRPAELLDIYLKSVGRNTNLLLSVTPDTRGLLPDEDVACLQAFGETLRRIFHTNLAADARIQSGDRVVTLPAEVKGALEFVFATPQTFDWIALGEDLTHGQRVEAFKVEMWSAEGWQEIAQGTTVGYKRLFRLGAPRCTERLRVEILSSRLDPVLAAFGLFLGTEKGTAKDIEE